MLSELRLCLLGKPQVTLNQKSVSGFVSTKVQALLYYLAITGQPHSRESLAALLWGDMPDVEAKANLRNALSNLRKLVGSHLTTDRESAALNQTLPYWLDVAKFEALVSAAPLADLPTDALRQAVDLYSGDLLDGFVVKDALEFDDWLAAQRQRLRQQVTQVLFFLSQRLAEQGDTSTAITCTNQLLALEPWHEAAHRQMMRLLVRSGQRGAALRQYERCRQILAEELGVEPAAETTALYHRLKRVDSPPPHNLPLQITPFFGRQTELARIITRLDNPDCRLLTLVGPGGIGKTRLAVEAAARCVQEASFKDGIFFVPVMAGAPLQPDALAAAIAAAIGFTPTDFTRPAAQLLAHLRGQELLLLLDGMEQAVTTAEGQGLDWLLGALRQAPGVKLLLTSRERLNVQEEWPLAVGGLDYPPPSTPLAELASYGAVALFLQQARQARPGFELTPADAPAIARLCRLVDGMPLALELAAAWLRASTPAEIVAETEQNLDFLTSPVRNVPARHRSLRAVFDQSWQRLTEAEQAALRQLAVFQGGFSRQAAGEVAGASLPLLAGLVDKSLLRMSPAGRYDMHELLRQYAAGKLAQNAAEHNAALDHHAHYYATFVQQWRKAFERDGSPERLADLNAEAANLRLGWQRAITPGSVVNINHYWYLGQSDQIKYLAPSMVTELHPAAPDWDEGQAVHRQGLRAFYQGDYPLARRHFTTALHLFSVAEDSVYVARAQVMLGQLAYLAGHDAEAESLLRQGVVGLKAAGDHRYRSYVLTNLAQLTGDIAPAKTALQESLMLNQTIGSRSTTAHILKNLGRLELAEGHFEEARAHFTESLAIFRDRQEAWGIASTLPLLGQAAAALNDVSAAEAAFKEALTLGQQHRFEPLLLETLVGLAELAVERDHGRDRTNIAAWLRLATQHPAARRDTRQRADYLLTEAGLSAEPDEETLSAVVAAILQA